MKRYCYVLLIFLWGALGDIFLDEKYEAGYIDLGEQRHHQDLFYMLFHSRDGNPNAPLVWFFEGGPGMTSLHSVFFQNGPYRINPDLTLRKNDYSFTNIAEVLYVDQPLGTGFSNVTNISLIPHHESVIVDDCKNFFVKFLEKHPEYHDRPLYLVSQGYGSHFILPLAENLTRDHMHHVNFQGIALGNAWIRPEIQISSLSSYSKKNNLCHEFAYIASLYGYILSSVFIDLDMDVQAYEIVMLATGVLRGVMNHKFNQYDTRIKCKNGTCDYNFSILQRFLDQPEVRKLLGTQGRNFNISSFEVFRWLLINEEYLDDKSDNLIHLLNNTNITCYLFSGMHDWWINTFGLDQFMDSLHWSGREQMKNAEWREWYSDGQRQGRYKNYRNLYYVHVEDAGHYVAMDLPSFALDLLTRLTYGSN
jgi:cathepsin A (carboxypeptidase C)